ncbi:isoaspartyl peptidase/L-asparaginase family protein [Fibrella aquatilis]|uniref:N(4)-(Beta-N-acetylglucosaminyl)-L-asparaginase n=1 Tax=Fibrella aquatilis TaxID=2817059 RepID=A0A939G8S0_9BACT|nr:N(4)-(beta-N-acetylglucosaminyl)-L-asparaginase [Fibrella aquatilis]MBO0933080.1 N(4)-(beta-N-acetylglucosaminyl)-L-asparaginase [Fibrella aquatilis]
MLNRRYFLRLGALLPTLTTTKLFAKSQTATVLTKPIVLSTWDSGVTANKGAWAVLSKGGKAIDAMEQAGIAIENEPSCCVGLGGNPDRDGHVTLDACIMDDNFNCGSVAFLERIKHPVSVARKVMDATPHVMLVGVGAQQFALANGFALEPDLLSAEAKKSYQEWLKKSEYKPIINIENGAGSSQSGKGSGPKKKGGGPYVDEFAPNYFDDGTPNHDTMGSVAMDAAGNLSGMCTTSGMAFKMRGRVGDSPLIGPGLYVDNEVGAVTGSGQGEEVIRMCGAHTIIELMRQGLSPKKACKQAIERIVKRDPARAKDFQVGFIAISKAGEIGAYAVQKGFSYTLTTPDVAHMVYPAESYFA